MTDLDVNYIEHKGKYLFCIRTQKGYGIRVGKGYKIVAVHENNGDYFYDILTEQNKTWGFKSSSNSFLSVEESQAKLRELKLTRILGGAEDDLFYTDEN